MVFVAFLAVLTLVALVLGPVTVGRDIGGPARPESVVGQVRAISAAGIRRRWI